jgi:hypothetical protein
MLSSVPITIGGENYSLQFTPQDVDEIEVSQRGTALIFLIQKERMLGVGTMASFLQFGLKVLGKFGPHGEPVRALTTRTEALELVHAHTTGRPLASESELVNVVYRALAAGGWYNLAETLKMIEKEASTSMPQGDSTPKNLEEPGLRLLKN